MRRRIRMKSSHWFTAMIVGLLCLAVSMADAGTLREDYLQMEKTRKDLEKKRNAHETRLEGLCTALKEEVVELNECIDQRREVLKAKGDGRMYKDFVQIWEMRFKEAEMVRTSTEALRKEIDELRKSLDNVRVDFEKMRQGIEKKYAKIRRDHQYEKDFREYMAKMQAEYFDRIRGELFSEYENYINGVEGYKILIESSLDLCRKQS